jgi:SMI1 / KNR4 family (SUKH-1)
MSADLMSLLVKFRRAATGAPSGTIQSVSERLATVFPTDYVAFMSESNGGEGEVGSRGYLQLWPIETLVEQNEACNTAEFFPGFIFLGSDGGGEGLGGHPKPATEGHLKTGHQE